MPDDYKSLVSWQKKVYQMVFFCLLFLLLYLFTLVGSNIKEILIAFSIAILINYLLAKPVDILTKYIRIRALSVITIYMGFITSLIVLGVYLFPVIAAQLKALKIALPAIVENFELALIATNDFLRSYQIELPIRAINQTEMINRLVSAITKLNFSDFGTFVTAIFLSSVSAILYVILTLILSFYLLLDGNKIWELFLVPFSRRFTIHLRAIKKKVDASLNAYIVGQFQIASLTALVMLATYITLNIPYAVILALVQMLEIIPVIGTWTAIVPCITVICFTSSPYNGLIAFIVYLIYSQLIRDNFIAPRILSSALGFHPVVVILTLIIGAQIAGAAGVILALPLLAVVLATLDYFVELSKLKVDQ